MTTPDIAGSRCVLTTRAARWSTRQVGRSGRAVTDVAGDLGCGWHHVDLAGEWVAEISRDFTDQTIPIEVRRLGRTITKWADQITAWHRSRVSNGPTEAVGNLMKRIKRVAFGITNFRHHRARCLLYAGKPNWDLLPTIQR